MLGEKWKALSPKERKPYEDKAAADKKRYEDEKAAYQVCKRIVPCLMGTITDHRLHIRLAATRRRNRPKSPINIRCRVV